MAVHALSMHTKDVYLNMNNIKNSAILQIVEFLFLQKIIMAKTMKFIVNLIIILLPQLIGM